MLSAFIRLEDHVCSHGFMGMDTCIGFYREAKKYLENKTDKSCG
jgi:hypothetical protein